MFKYYFVIKTLAVIAFCAGDSTSLERLPSWIKDNPGFQNPTELDSIMTGKGSIWANETGNKGWRIFLNEKAGHGIEIEVEELNLNPDSDEFLLVSPWPIDENFKQLQLFTGTFKKPLKKLRIPSTRTFCILFSASQNSAKMALNYRRYGSSLEVGPPPTDVPIKKETVYEIQLKGKTPDEFSDPEFLTKVKKALRSSAKRYCAAHEIPFYEDIKLEEMVLIHRISFCPFEWPDRNVCTSLEHSIYVSGISIPGEEFILNYQLTTDHLKKMWSEDSLLELRELGITVFELPATSNTVLYWSLIIGLMIISSLIGTFVFWKGNSIIEQSSRKNSTSSYEIKKTKKPKLKLAKHQQVPSFMYKNSKDIQMESIMGAGNEEARLKQKAEIGLKAEDSSELPIKNYFGGILFGINRGFEDEEETPSENPKNPPLKRLD